MEELNEEVVNSLRVWVDPAQVLQVVRAASNPMQRKARMNWLKLERPELYPVILGLMYDVSVYKVGDSDFRDDAPEDQREMYFAATLGSDFPDSPGIPLAPSYEEAFRATCEVLGLERLFELECEVGHRLPRLHQITHEAAA